MRTWLNTLQAKGERCHKLFLFCDWAEKTPAQLLKMKNGGSLEVEHLLDEFVGLDGDGDAPYPNSVMWACVQAVKSFCKRNYKALQPLAGAMTLRKVKPYRKHTKEQVRLIYQACMNPRDRSMVSMAFSTAMAKETLMKLKWLYFEDGWQQKEVPHLELPSHVLKGHGLGKWQGVKQETFLTPRAKTDLIQYKEWMERERKVQFALDSHVYRSLHPLYKRLSYNTMGEIPQLISLRTMKHDPPFAFSWHDARRYVQTALEEAGLERNWIQKIKGRKVRGEDAPYSRPEIEKLRHKYREALSCVCFLDADAVVAKHEMDKVKLALGERTLREQELIRRVAELEKDQQDIQTIRDNLPFLLRLVRKEKERLEK